MAWLTDTCAPLLLLVVLPLAAGGGIFALRRHAGAVRALAAAYALAQLAAGIALYAAGGFSAFSLPLSGQGVELRFAWGSYNGAFVLLAALVFAPVCIYAAGWLREKAQAGEFLLYLLLSDAAINGALLSDNLAGMLFFWEGMLCTQFLFLLMGNTARPRTAVKALTISGMADLLLMGGIAVTASAAGTFTISEITALPMTGVGRLGFVLMFLGAAGKAGCMPFHSWIPDAAADAQTPFLVAFPGSMEKLAGIYLCVRLVYQMYDVRPGSLDSTLMMTLGVLTLLFAVSMALIQKDMKRLMAYHAVSQVGYMILGIGTCLPIGLVGGLFHMLNNAVYKACLFMTAGAVEQRTGTTDARKLGGLAKVMPVTAACFTLSALAIAGVPPFNGFFSKELIFDAALEGGVIFYLGALLGAVMTAISFLKLGRALFTGETKMPAADEQPGFVPQAPNLLMTVPMCVLAAASLVLGIGNALPVDGLFGAAMGYTERFAGWPKSPLLVCLSLAALALAVADHVYGCRKTGAAITAADHIHEAPVLRQIYELAGAGVFDPYNWIKGIAAAVAFCGDALERGLRWLWELLLFHGAQYVSGLLSQLDSGEISLYIGMAFLGLMSFGFILLFYAV